MTVLGVASDYQTLRAILNDRRRNLGLRFLDLDEKSGVAAGYSSKLLTVSAQCAQHKVLGPISTPLVLEALRVRIAIVPKGTVKAPDRRVPAVTFPEPSPGPASVNDRDALEEARRLAGGRPCVPRPRCNSRVGWAGCSLTAPKPMR